MDENAGVNNSFQDGREAAPEKPFRCGYVAIIGEPNVGKSTFLNTALAARISIVTSKPQTTRRQIIGLLNDADHQVVFVDTPGLITPSYLLQKSMLRAALDAAADADALLLIVDAQKALEREHPLPVQAERVLDDAPVPAVLALNKVDLVYNKSLLLPLMDRLSGHKAFKAVVPMSALRNDGVDSVMTELIPLLPEHPPLFPPEALSDQPERFFVSEIIREKIFEMFHREVPYATEVFITEYKEKDDLDFIAAEILVERESQKRILIGKQGSAVRELGTRARTDIEQFLGRKVFLDLHVRVRERWRDNREWVRRLGYSP